MSIIGIDLDNTIVCYNRLFHHVALLEELIPFDLETSKTAVRDYLREQNKEDAWTELQGMVYGKHMYLASSYQGFSEFIERMNSLGRECRIISHRTQYPVIGPHYDLHQFAWQWLSKQGYIEMWNFDEKKVFFELTIDDKLERIKSENCSVFIDDLPEFLDRPEMPKHLRPILFDPESNYQNSRLDRASSWEQICQMIQA